MNFISRIAAFFRGRNRTQVPPRVYRALDELTPQQYFDLLEAYYLNNGLYDEITLALRALSIYHEGLKPLRNPANRAVEFYASTLWNAPFQILTKNAALVTAIEKIHEWSNWAEQKQVFVRWLATFGNQFTKVAQSEDGERVFLQNIKPQYVTDYDADVRGYLTMCRIDTPVIVAGKNLTRTEVWDKPTQTLRIWDAHSLGDAPLEMLGAASSVTPFAEFNIDFVPIVHTKLRAVGNKRGVGAFVMALDKIDEANLLATRLHQMLFRNNRVLWALMAKATDASGRPLPPPNVTTNNDNSATDPFYELGEDRMVRLPGNAELASLVPDLNYDAALKILQDQMVEIEHDLPELAYYRIRDMNEIAAETVRLLLTDATNRLLEARNNAEAALVRLDAMALTIASNARLKGFESLGSFENGDFAHSFAAREVIAISEKERAETIKTTKESGVPLLTAVRRNGWNDTEIEQMEKDQAADDERKFAQQKRAMELQFGSAEN